MSLISEPWILSIAWQIASEATHFQLSSIWSTFFSRTQQVIELIFPTFWRIACPFVQHLSKERSNVGFFHTVFALSCFFPKFVCEAEAARESSCV
jgi:hypothetical protein